MDIFAKVVSEIRGSDAIVIEIGANDGAHTQMFLNHFPAGRIFCFEPDPRAIRKHEASICDPRSTLIKKAVGRRTETAVFHQSSGEPASASEADASEGWDQSGSLRQPKRHLNCYPWVRFEHIIEVEVTSLDNWASAEGIKSIDLIWADVQGAEADMILGAQRTLDNTKFLFTEYSIEELYDGAPCLREILEMLPDFEVLLDFPGEVDGNALLRHK